VCLGFDDVEPQPVLLGLDRAGISVHSGSSCSSESLEPSPVLEAMGVDAHRSLRVSVGWTTTDDDIEAFGRALPAVLEPLRALARG
jgi:cysteine desulfurase